MVFCFPGLVESAAASKRVATVHCAQKPAPRDVATKRERESESERASRQYLRELRGGSTLKHNGNFNVKRRFPNYVPRQVNSFIL